MQIGAQDHFYLETNTSMAVPGEGSSLEVFASTQNPAKTQDFCAKVCGVDKNKVRWRSSGLLRSKLRVSIYQVYPFVGYCLEFESSFGGRGKGEGGKWNRYPFDAADSTFTSTQVGPLFPHPLGIYSKPTRVWSAGQTCDPQSTSEKNKQGTLLTPYQVLLKCSVRTKTYTDPKILPVHDKVGHPFEEN